MKECLKKIDYTFYDLLLQNHATIRIVLHQTNKRKLKKVTWYDYSNQCFGPISSSTKYQGSVDFVGHGSLADAFYICKWLSSYLNVGIEIEVKDGEERLAATIFPQSDDFLFTSIKELDNKTKEILRPLNLKVCTKELNDFE